MTGNRDVDRYGPRNEAKMEKLKGKATKISKREKIVKLYNKSYKTSFRSQATKNFEHIELCIVTTELHNSLYKHTLPNVLFESPKPKDD